MKITGIHHVQLTVTDLKRSKDFYSKLPNFTLVANHPNFLMFFAGSFYIGMTDHKGLLREKVFNEKNTGLDHIAFEVASENDLAEALTYLDIEKIPHGKIKILSNGAHVLAFRDPDNIQLEFAWRKQ
ncbi:MAG TPA: VOC family protein [Patescibacteria group bacterium]|nr:VOC family protein [Patescibacteria group bacterium]